MPWLLADHHSFHLRFTDSVSQPHQSHRLPGLQPCADRGAMWQLQPDVCWINLVLSCCLLKSSFNPSRPFDRLHIYQLPLPLESCQVLVCDKKKARTRTWSEHLRIAKALSANWWPCSAHSASACDEQLSQTIPFWFPLYRYSHENKHRD